MPSWTKLVGGWLLAAAVAVAFSWGAVAQVRNRVIQPTIEIPTTVLVAASTTVANETSTTGGADPTVIRVEPEVVSDTTSGSTQPESEPTTTSTTTTTTTAAQNGGTTTTQPPAATTITTTAPTATTEPPATTTTTTTTTAPPETQTASYQLEGGVVTISYSPGVVNFVSAIPQPGYSTDKRETGPDRVRIRFESESHTSDFRAEWEAGGLQITKNETGEDG